MSVQRSPHVSHVSPHLLRRINLRVSRTYPTLFRVPSVSSSDLEHLRDPDPSDILSLHSNPGSSTHRRARRRRVFGRLPIYISDDDDEADGGRKRTRASITTSSSTLNSDAAPLDASTIERLTSPVHHAALAAQRERERDQRQLEDEARRKVRARAEVLRSLSGTASSLPDDDARGAPGEREQVWEWKWSGPGSYNAHHQGVEVVSSRLHSERLGGDGDADDANLDRQLHARKKKPSTALSASGSDSRSRTSVSFSAGDAYIHAHAHVAHQSILYPHTEMHLPAQMMNNKTKKLSYRASKRKSAVSSVTSQPTSTVPYTPVESVVESPAVAAFHIPQKRYMSDEGQTDFPSAGLLVHGDASWIQDHLLT